MWDEPDVTRPQIIVTKPDGSWHYLVDPETYWAKRRQRSERLYNENCWDAQLTQTSMMPFPSKIPRADVGMSSRENIAPKETPSKQSKLLKGKMTKKWKQCRSLVHDSDTIPLSKTVQLRRQNLRESEELRTDFREETEGTLNLKLSGLFSMMRTIAWNW